LSGSGPEFVYLSDLDYSGTDQFTFVVSDGALQSSPATVNITVNPVNDPPVADDLFINTQANKPASVTLTGSDPENDPISFSVVTAPANGSLSGSAPSLTYTPNSGYVGSDSFTFKANDGSLDSQIATVFIMVEPYYTGPIFSDDFETDMGWIVNPFSTDTATSGTFERGNPEDTNYMGYKQLGTTHSGSYNLVTGALAGADAGAYDLDGGITSIRSPMILLPTEGDITLSFWYYFAHANNSSSADYLRVRVVGATTQQIFQEVGASVDDDAAWQEFTFSLNGFRGQTIYLLITAADLKGGSLVEAAIDDVLISAE